MGRTASALDSPAGYATRAQHTQTTYCDSKSKGVEAVPENAFQWSLYAPVWWLAAIAAYIWLLRIANKQYPKTEAPTSGAPTQTPTGKKEIAPVMIAHLGEALQLDTYTCTTCGNYIDPGQERPTFHPALTPCQCCWAADWALTTHAHALKRWDRLMSLRTTLALEWAFASIEAGVTRR